MKTLARLALLLVVAVSVGKGSPALAQGVQDKFKLKPGAKGKVCLTCHVDFEDTLKLPSVHAPVKAGNCSACHSPHASDHGKLLAEEPSKICLECHAEVLPKDAKSVHQPALEGNCVKCHDPHAAKNRKNLLAAGNDLCFGCHKELASSIQKVQFKHAPVEKNCLNCHDPHASPKSDFLLKKEATSLCVSCHDPKQPVFAQQHMGYPVAKGRCTSCHDPHGSSNQAILWASVHPPVRSKMCTQCHLDASSPEALKTKRRGVEVCRSCHNDLVNQIFASKRLHWPVADKVGCLNCHGPHATREKPLLKKPMKPLCGSCHADTIKRQENSPTKHAPIDGGECTSCHSPHGSENAFLFTASSQLEVCGACHDWKAHSAHPLGEKAIDPRNKNLAVDCESCHRAHGTPFKYFTHFDNKAELCVQCHADFRR